MLLNAVNLRQLWFQRASPYSSSMNVWLLQAHKMKMDLYFKKRKSCLKSSKESWLLLGPVILNFE